MAGRFSTQSAEAEVARLELKDGSPLVGRFEDAAPDGGSARVTLVVDALGTKAGTRVTVAQAPGVRLRRPLSDAVNGTEKFPALVRGDVVAFASAYVSGGVAMVGEIAARSHVGMGSKMQAFTAMVRVGQSKVGKRGAFQSVTVADGKAAVAVRSYAAAAEALETAAKREWPGGEAGMIVRVEDGSTTEFFGEPRHLAQEMENAGILDEQGSVVELIPVWRMPTGRHLIGFEVDPRTETAGWVHGPTSRLFEGGKAFRGQGFLPCFMVVADEDEWAFGGPTGKVVRASQGVVPVLARPPVHGRRLPSAVRAYGGAVNTVLSLYGKEELAARRMEKEGEQAVTAPVAPPSRGPRPPAFSRGMG